MRVQTDANRATADPAPFAGSRQREERSMRIRRPEVVGDRRAGDSAAANSALISRPQAARAAGRGDDTRRARRWTDRVVARRWGRR